jgi:ankyrin repeat protein
LELGINVNAVNENNQTALHGAADRGADKIVKYLADHGAKLDVKDHKGLTPLAMAAGSDSYGHPGYPSTEVLLRKLMSGTNGEK